MSLQLFRYILLGLLLYGHTFYAQKNDTIQQLKEVLVVSDLKLKENSIGVKILKLNDSILKSNSTNLTTFLRFNSNLYLRELSIGGTASVSFRGTSASQTAVVWNGLNINSQTSGQTDFNTISVRNYDEVSLRSGGGSIGYGSGAVGGTIHLNSHFKFKDHFNQRLITSLGSYSTYHANYKLSLGSNNYYVGIGVDYTQSENDYKFLSQKGKKNENAAYDNLNLNYDVGVKISDYHSFKFYNNVYLGERNFSSSLFLNSNDGYENLNYRHMLQYIYSTRKFTSTLSAAYLYEKYKYISNTDNPDNFDFGKSENYTLKYNFDYRFSDKINLKAIAQYEAITGDGTNTGEIERPRASLAFLFTHKLNTKLDYSFNLRQEVNDFDSLSLNTFFDGLEETYSDIAHFNDVYDNANDNPFIFSLGSNYKFSNFYTLKFNASKNFSVPTFNDLYWRGQGGKGNIDLKSEKSVQAEITNEFNFGGVNIKLTGFYIKSKDLIVWQPNEFNTWIPINIDKVYNYGVETHLNYKKSWKNHSIEATFNLTNAISKDKTTEQQLLYKPRYSITRSLSYSFKNLGFFYQFNWIDDTYVTTDKSRKIKAYDVSNAGVSYKLPIKKGKEYRVSFAVNNIYNEVYFLDVARPAPNRNYKLQILLNF